MATQGFQPIFERNCRNCGVRLSRYNPAEWCWPCQDRGHRAASLPSPLLPVTISSHQGTLRSLLTHVQNTQPEHFSDIGQVLKQYRSVHRLTQRDLATLLGFDQSSISKLERGQGLRD